MAPRSTRPRRPLSKSASTASCNMRFSLRTMTSGACRSISFFKPVVAVDDAAVEIIQIRGGKAAAVQRNQGAQLRRNDRDHVQDHPVRFVAALAEGFDHLQPLGVLQALLQRGLGLHLLAQLGRERLHVHALEQFLDRFRAHHGLEAGGPVLLVEFAELGFVLDDFALFDGASPGSTTT